MDYEGEIVLIIGKSGRRIAEADAYDHVAGVTYVMKEPFVMGATREVQCDPRENWDRSGAIGPWIVPFTGPELIEGVSLETRVNGEVRQQTTPPV